MTNWKNVVTSISARHDFRAGLNREIEWLEGQREILSRHIAETPSGDLAQAGIITNANSALYCFNLAIENLQEARGHLG